MIQVGDVVQLLSNAWKGIEGIEGTVVEIRDDFFDGTRAVVSLGSCNIELPLDEVAPATERVEITTHKGAPSNE